MNSREVSPGYFLSLMRQKQTYTYSFGIGDDEWKTTR